jgi:type II secretion system protein J
MRTVFAKKVRASSRRLLREKGGFTLIEIMIAISIFMMVMVAIYSSWSAIMHGSRVGMAAAAEVQRTRVALRALEEGLASAVIYSANGKYYHFATDLSHDHAYINFVARLPSSFPGSGKFGDNDLRRVCFYVKDGNLMLAQSPLLEATKRIGKPYTIPLAPNVSMFDMEFYSFQEKKWFAEWNSTNTLPQMVRVAIGFTTGDGYTKSQRVTIRSIPLTAMAITPAGGGLPGGSGNSMAPNLAQQVFKPIAPGATTEADELWSALLPDDFRAGAHYRTKDRNSLFPPE